jgi:hypothetical protein
MLSPLYVYFTPKVCAVLVHGYPGIL